MPLREGGVRARSNTFNITCALCSDACPRTAQEKERCIAEKLGPDNDAKKLMAGKRNVSLFPLSNMKSRNPIKTPGEQFVLSVFQGLREEAWHIVWLSRIRFSA